MACDGQMGRRARREPRAGTADGYDGFRRRNEGDGRDGWAGASARRLVGGGMVIPHVLELVAGLLLPAAAVLTTNPPAIAGIWESEGCVVQRDLTRTSSRSTFVFLENEWALELVQYSDE